MPKFRLPDLPAASCDSAVEIADWWELEAIRAEANKTSLGSLRRTAIRPSESDPETDITEDIEEEARFDFAIEEIRLRQLALPDGHYPFVFGSSERVLKFEHTNPNRWLYIYLLLATRLNMTDRKVQVGIDGALLFEEVCEVALKAYAGPRHRSHRFGTSAGQGNFSAKLTALFKDLNEFSLRDDREIPNHGGDAGLDLALWGQFTWKGTSAPRRGKLILLAQCKTGTSWGDADLSRLQPKPFFDCWMAPPPLGETTRAFMVASCIEQAGWENCHRLGGLIFDRLRVVDCAATHIPAELASRIRKWTQAALKCEDLPGN